MSLNWQDKEKEAIAEWQAQIAIVHDVLCELGLKPGKRIPKRDVNGRERFTLEGEDFELPNAESKRKALEFFSRTGRATRPPKDYAPAGGGNVRIDLDVFYAVLVPLINEALKRKR